MVSRFPSKGPASQALLGDRYQIEERLGRGGMACVYRVTRRRERAQARAQAACASATTPRHERELAALFEREYHTLAQLVASARDRGLRLRRRRRRAVLHDGAARRRRPARARAAAVARSVRAALRRVLVARAAALAPAAPPRRQPAQRALHARRPRQADRLRRDGADGREATRSSARRRSSRPRRAPLARSTRAPICSRSARRCTTR